MAPESVDHDSSPIEKLVFAILLSAAKKGARVAALRRVDGQAVVELEIDGVVSTEMRPPTALLPRLLRMLSVMASLPMHGRDEIASGHIELAVGDDRRLWFALQVRGHGDLAEARIFVLPGAPARA